MATFAEMYAVYNTASFKVKVGIAVVRVAVATAGESTAGHIAWTRKRADLSRLVLSNPAAVGDRFALILASQDVPAAETDEVIENKVRDIWDATAGVTAEDRGVQ